MHLDLLETVAFPLHFPLWVIPDGLHILICWTWYAYWCNLTWECSQMFLFDVVYAIYNIYIGILSFSWVMIVDEICHMPFNCVSFDLDWDDTIMSRWYFERWLDNSYCCLLFTVLSICEKSATLLYVAISFLSHAYDREFFSGYQFQTVFLCLVASSI